MYNRQFFTKSFWTSKLGQASLASIAAMCAMIVFTSQFEASQAHTASAAFPHSELAVLAEIA